jgi:uncharacterized protein (DUF4415 family)
VAGMRKNYDFGNSRRGPVVQQPGRTRVSIYLDDDLLKILRKRADASGRGYGSVINEALREFLGRSAEPPEAATRPATRTTC